jgi:hypothetical protein
MIKCAEKRFVLHSPKDVIATKCYHQSFSKKVVGVHLDTDECLISFDVTALFTSVPVDEVVNIIKDKLMADESLKDRTMLTPDDIALLLDFILKTTYFAYNGRIYQQTYGAAMGSPISPLVANAFMEHLKVQAPATAAHPPRTWLRYVDDTFVIIEKEYIEELSSHINEFHLSIKFTSELQKDNTLPFLDALVYLDDSNTIQLDIYRKPTHTDHYLNYDSHHPKHQKLGIIKTLFYRCNTIVSEEHKKTAEK